MCLKKHSHAALGFGPSSSRNSVICNILQYKMCYTLHIYMSIWTMHVINILWPKNCNVLWLSNVISSSIICCIYYFKLFFSCFLPLWSFCCTAVTSQGPLWGSNKYLICVYFICVIYKYAVSCTV